MRLIAVGRVGRPHGRDGSFHVEGADHPLPEGLEVSVGGRAAVVERRAGTDASPLLRVSLAADRDGAAALRGERILLAEAEAPLAEGEWLTEDLLGCRIDGLGEVRAVVAGSSCDVLEVGEEGTLVPLVSDAIVSIDPGAKVIEIDRRFLGLS